jgi:RNA polymerase sigma factor (sigma-70 family)
MEEPRGETASVRGVRAAEPHGAPAAFEEAYLRYAPLLRKIAVRKFGISPADAEPLVHDVFATYLTHSSQVQNLEGYLIGGICNASRHHLRRGAAASELFCGEEPCAAAPTESIALEVERKILIGRLLGRIGSRCRELLHRYYVNGETTSAIAGELQFKPASVLIFLSKCRQKARLAYHALHEGRS